MNKIFKVIWSKSKQCYIVVSEIAKNKTGKKKIVVAGIFAALAMVNSGYSTFAAAPSGEGVQSAFWVGRGASASGQNAQAIGVAARANQNKAIAIGSDSSATSYVSGSTVVGATAIGGHSNANGPGAVALGYGTNASVGYSTAIGTATNVSGQYGIGIGWNTSVSADNSTAIGVQSRAAKAGATAMGPSARGYGEGALSLGYQALAGADVYGSSINVNNNPSDDNNSTINNYGKWGDAAIGLRAVATGGNATALGRSARAVAANAIAIGGGNGDSATDNTEKTEATGEKSTAIGYNAKAKNTNDIAIGMTANASDGNAIAIGRNVTSAGGASTSIGYYSSVTGNQSIGIGSQISNSAQKATAIGYKVTASGSGAIGIGSGTDGGSNVIASGSDAIALGTSTLADSEKAIAIGANSKGTNIGATALGRSSEATGASATALGSLASATGSTATAVGMQASASGTDSVAVGKTASATNNRALAVGTNAKATGENSVAVGSGSGGSGNQGFVGSLNSTGGAVNTTKTINYATTAEGDTAVAVGYYANAKNKGVAIGQTALAATGGVAIGKGVFEDTGNSGAGGVVIGQDSTSTGVYSLAMGRNAVASGSTSMAIGYAASADGGYAVAMGRKVSATGTSTAIGHHATASNGGLAIGSQDNDTSNDRTTASATGAVAIGKNAKATSEDAVAIGTNAQATLQGAVALGSGSTTATGATNQGSTTINGITYNFAGATGNPNMQVSVGSAGATRQIKNVAAGEVSATSTDAINGSQLYAVASAVKPLKYVSVNSAAAGTGSNVDNDGAQGGNSIAIGPSSTVTRQNGIAIGNGAKSLSEESIVIGRNAQAETKTGAGLTTTSRAIAIGSNSRVAANVTQGIAIGSGLSPDEGAVVTGDQSIAIGGNVKVDGHAAIAIGGDDAKNASNQQVSYTNTDDTEVTGTLRNAILDLTGYDLSKYKGTTAGHAGVAYGTSALAGNAGVAIGTAADSMTRMNDKGQVVNDKPVTNAVAIGTGARANFDNSVAIGGGSNTDHYATKQVNAVIDGVEVKWSGGENISPGDVVSFGAKGFERQLKNVAPGEVSQTSTDAVNGSQIYSLARKVTNIMNGGSGSVVNVNSLGQPLSKVVTTENGNKVEKYYRTSDIREDGTVPTGTSEQTPTSLALVNVSEPNANLRTTKPRILGNVANGVNDNDAVNVSQLKAATVKYFSVNSTVGDNRNNDKATGTNAIAVGPAAQAAGNNTVSVGYAAGYQADGKNNVGIGTDAGRKLSGDNNISIGSSSGNNSVDNNPNKRTTYTNNSVMLGNEAKVIDSSAQNSIDNVVVIGNRATSSGTSSVVLGTSASGTDKNTIAIGNSSKATSISAVALGNTANATGLNAMALGLNTNASDENSVAIGNTANASAKNTLAMGTNTKALSEAAIALGTNAESSGFGSIAIGEKSKAQPTTATSPAGSVAIGYRTESTGDFAVALGSGNGSYKGASANGVGTVAVGTATVTASGRNFQTVVGFGARTNNEDAAAFGHEAKAYSEKSLALGSGSSATVTGGVALGSGSVADTDKNKKGFDQITGRTDTYAGLKDEAFTSTAGAISVGNVANKVTRQITGVAAGTNDTDAVNVAQLKSVNLAFTGNTGNGGDVNLSQSKLALNGDNQYITTKADGKTLTISGKKQEITVSNGVASASSGMADASNVAQAITQAVSDAKYNWKLSANGQSSTETIAKGDTVDFSGDNNITVSRTGKNISTKLNDTITVDSVNAKKKVTVGTGANQIALDGTLGVATVGASGPNQIIMNGSSGIIQGNKFIGNSFKAGRTSIDNDGLTIANGPSVLATGINAGNKQITGVTSGGTIDTNAANIGDVKKAVANVSQNLNISDGTNNSSVALKSQTLTVAGTGAAKATVNNQTITIDVAEGTLTPNTTNGTVTGTTGVAKATEVAAAINNTNTVLGNKITKNAQDIATNTSNITANKNQITTNTTNIATNTTNIAHTIALADDKGTSTTAKSLKDGNVSFNIKGDNKYISTAASGNDVTLTVNEQAIKDAAKSVSSFKVKANTHAEEEVKGGDTIAFNNGDNIEISQNGKTFTIGTAKNITVDSVTAGNTVINTSGLTNGTTAITGTGITTDKVTVGGISIDKTAGINAGGKVISNVASGTVNNNATDDSNAANIGDVKQAVANLSQNLNITDGTNNGTVDLKNQKLNVAGANGVTATVNNQKITVGLDANTVNATTKGMGLTADTGSTGNKYLKDGDVSFAVTGDGNLVSTSATAAGVKVAVDTAKVKDLAVAAVTVSKDTQADNPIMVTPTAGTNSKDYAIGIDTTKLAAKTDLTYRANSAADTNAKKVSLSKGLNFVDGGSTVATVDNDGKVSFDLNTATKNQINTNTTDIATNTAALARNISLGADSGTTSSQSLSKADVAFNVKGATGDFVSTNMNGNTVEISTKRATINSNATTGEASVTGNDGLATAQNVADAINKAADAAKAGAAWNITTNSSTTDKTAVKGGDTVDLVNGDNIEITQDGTDKKKITVATKKDITVDSVTANNKVTVGSGANKITLDGTDGSVTGKAFTGTTFTGTSFTGTSFTAGNTVINTNGLTNGTTAITGTGVTTDNVTVGGISIDKTTGINAGNKVISNVASGGTTATNAANIGDVQNAVANLSQNLNITDGTHDGTVDLKNQKLNVAGANGVTATVNNQTITVGLDADTVNATTKGIGLTADTGSTGNKYLKDGDVSFAVTGDGSLVSTSATAAGVKVAVNSATITAGADGTITGPTTDGVATAQNVADAINAAKKASKTEITANTGEAANATTGNVTLTSTTAADGHTIYDVKLNDKVTLGTGANAVTVDGTTGAITGKTATIGGVTVNGTANTIGGLSNTTWNGTAVSGRAATEDQLKAATGATTLKFTGDVAANTGSVNLKDDTFGIKGDGKYISTDVNGKNVNLTVSEAEVKKSAVAAVTVSTDTTDANNPLTVTPTTSADGTTKDYKVTIDGTKIANKTNLSYKANDGAAKQVSLADGLNFKNGTLTTASIDDAGVVKYDVNTASITAGADGTITGPTTDGVATAKNVADAINAAKKASKTEITANTGEAANATTGNVTLTSTTAADGHTIYDVKLNDKVTLGTGANAVTVDGTAGKATIGSSVVDGVNNTFTTGGAKAVTLNGATGTITGTTANLGVVTVDGTAGTVTGLTNKDWTPGVTKAVSGRTATEDQLQKVADAASSQTWQITADKDTATSGAQTGTKKDAKVGKDDKVQLIAGENMTVNQNERDFTFTLNKDLVKMNSATFEATGGKTTVIKGDSIVQTDGVNVNTSNATSNTITDGTNTSTITAGKAQIGTVGIDGVASKISTGGTNAVVVNGADGTIKTGTVTVTGGTTNDITGLSNTTLTATDFATKGRAATEEQLKAATGATTLKFTGDVATNTGSVNLKDDTFGIKGDGKYISTDVNGKNVNLTVSEAEVKKSAVAAVTVSTDTTDTNNPLTVTPTTSADGTTKDYKVTIDGTKIANKTNLSYKANDGTAKQVSLADGLNFKNGTLTTASIDDNGVVKYDVNTATITAGTDGTITGPTTDGVATAQNVADAINAAKKASKTEITANTGEAANATTGNVTLTSTTAADGHTIYDVKLNDKVTLGTGANAVTVDGTTGAITGKTANIGGVTVNGTANTIGGLSNTTWNGTATTGRAATEDQLKAVADAAGSQTWNITADKAGTTGNQTGTKKNATVGKDETVELVAGDNLTINQNERKFTYSLNKDLAGLTSVSIGTGTTETIKLDGATGKITAKNASIGGVTVDGDNNHVTGLANTTWNGTATTGRAATEDQLKAVAETAKTTTDAVNLKFSGNTNTSPGVVNLKDDTFGIVGDGKYVSTDANGKNLTVKVSEAEIKKSAVAAVTVSTDTTDANNPLTVTPTTSADGTTKDYKVTIDGTKIANKTNLSYKANDGTAKQVSLADGLNFKNGTLTTASIDDAGVVKYDVNTASITAGADGTITGPTTDGVATAQNVADAINAAKKASKTEITANTGEAANATTGNVTLTSTTAADGHTIYDVKLNDKVTLGTGANAVTIDGTAGKATIGSSVINGVNNTFTTGGAKAVTLDGATGTITGTTANIGSVTVNGTANIIGGLSNTTWNGTATTGRAATEDQLKAVADAAGSQTWEITADKKAGTSGAQTGTKENAKVGKDDKVSLIAGENLTVDQAGKNFTYSLNTDLVKMNSATFLGTGTNTTVITGDSITQTAGTQTNTSTAAGNTVANGTKSTETTADGQVIKDGTKINTSTVDENTIVDGARSNKTTVDSNVIDDGNGNVNISNATSNTITDGTNTSTITAGKATIGSSVIDGVNNTFTTGGANAVKLDGAAGTIKTGTVTVTGGTTNDITGLSNTTLSATDFATKGRAATEEQLKAATGATTLKFTGDVATNTGSVNLKDDTFGIKGDGKYISTDVNGKNVNLTVSEAEVKKSAVAAVTVSTDTTDANNPISVTPTTSADGTTKDYKVTIDGTKIANKTNLSYKANDGTAKQVSLADGLNFKNGTLTTASIDDAGVVKYDVNTAAITAGTDGTITGPTKDGVATAQNVADAINAAKKASKTEITANTGEAANATTGNVTLTSTTAADGHTIYDVKLNDKVTLGTGANAVTIDGTAGKATIGSSIVDGVNNTFTTGGASPVTLNGATGTITGKTANIGGVTVDGTNNHVMGLANKDWTPGVTQAVSGRAATEDQLQKVSDAVGAGWKVNTGKVTGSTGESNGAASTKVASGEEVQFQAGNNLIVDQNGKTVAYSLNKALKDLESATFNGTGTNKTVITGDSITQTAGTQTNTSTAGGNIVADGANSTAITAAGTTVTTANGNTNYAADGVRINTTGKTPVSLTDAGLDNGNNVIKNVASGHVNNDATDNTNAANIADVKKATTTVTANAGEAANATTGNVTLTSTTAVDGHTIYDVKLNDKVTLGTGANAVTIDGTAGKATVGSSVIDGVNNTFTTGGANAVKLDGAAGTIKTGTVTVTGGTTNDITGLSNTTVNSADFATKGRAATEEQLKAVGEQTWQITADKDATTSGAQTGTKKDAKVGKDDKVQLIAGENMTVNQNERDFTFTLNKDLVKMNSATFEATGGKTTVIKGDSIVQTDGTKVNTSTAGGNTVVDGTKSTATTADGTTVTSANGNTKYAADGVRINTTGKNPVSLTDAGLDNGNNVIKNVASGHVNNDATDNTNAANIADVKKATTTVTANAGEAANATKGNVILTSTTAADGHTIYDVKLNDKVTLGTGANAVTIDGTAGKATVGSSVIDGVNNTFTTGGASPVTLNGATGTITGKTANIGGVTVDGTNNHVMGLANKDWTPGVTQAVSGRAATEDQLQKVSDAVGAGWKINTGKVTGSTGESNGAASTKVASGEEVQFQAGNNLIVDQNGKTVAYSLNKALKDLESATFNGTGTNKTVITGDSITQTAGTQTNTSTAGGNTVADGTKSTETTAAGQVIKDGTKTNTSTVDENTIVDGAKSNKTTVDSNVIDDGTGNVNTSNATSNTITDGTNTTATTSSSVTIKDNAGNSTVITKDNVTTGVGGNKITLDGTAGKATVGSSVVDGVNNTFTTGGTNAVKLDGAAGTVKTGTVTVTGGTTNDITGLSNTTVTSADFATKGRAATEEQLKAVGEQTWQITADKDATTSGNQTGTKKDAKVGKDDKVQLIAGENLTVNQNERDFTYSLNKDLVKMNSATFEATGGKTTVIKGDSIVQTDGTKTNISTAAGNTVADGTKSTETTAAGYVIKDGAKSNKSTVDSNVIDDGNGNVNTSNATSNTIANGTDSTATTAAGTTVTNANGNTKYAADGVRINTTGKNPVSLTDAGLDNGNNVIKNVASGHVNNDDTDNTNAANIADVKKATTTVTANNGEAANATTGNVTLTSTTATDGHIIYDVKLNDKVTLGTGANAVTIDGTAGKATIGSSVVDGVNNTITTGGANAVVLDGAAGSVKTGTVTVTGGTTNDITGLSNTTVTSADFATKGRAATEEQLKAVGEQTWQITADKDATTSGNQTGTKKDAKVGKDDKVQLIAGENLTVNQNERDFTYSLNKDLVKMNSATFEATGGKTTVITGDSIAQTDGTKTNTSTAAGNTVADGGKSTATTADGTTVTNANGNTNYAADGVRINTTGKNPVSLTDAGLDNGNNVIKNVASGHVNNDDTDNTNAANIADVKKATTTVTANNGEAANATTGNVTLTSTTAADGHTIYDVKLNDTVTLGTGANAVTIDGTAGKATIGSSVVDGVNNTITTGGSNAVKLDGAAGTVKTGTVTVTGGTTNDITGLSNTTVTSADFATKGRAATEEQLKQVGEQTWQITADKDATTSGNQTGTKKDAKVGKDDKVQLIAGENLTVNQNERDFTYSLNKDLVKMNSATFEATGGKTTVITGSSIAQTDGTKTNTSTAAGNTVADGTKSTETTAAGQVIKDGAKTNTSTVDENTLVDGAKSNKTTVDSNVIDDGNGNVNTSNATSNTITDGTNTTEATASTVTVKDNAGNSTVITKDTLTTGTGANKVTVDGTAGKVTAGSAVVDGVNNTITTGGANTVKLDGAAGTVTGLTNTAWTPGVTKAMSGRAATEDQLQQVSDAVGAGWNINSGTVAGSTGEANGSAKTKISSGEEVQLQAGNNLIIDQNGKTLSYSLNKNLKDMESAIFNATGGKTTVIKGDSIVQTDGGKTNTSNAAGNTVVDGTKSTATTAAGTTITDGAKTNTSTADKNVINDGAGNTNTSNATSNTIADPNGNTNTATATNNTLADNAGNSNVSNATSNSLTDNAGNSNISNATSNTLKNAAGDETKVDAKGATVKDAAGNTTNVAATGATVTNAAGDTTKVEATGTTVADAAGNKATFTKDGVTITKPGKDTVSLTGNGLDNGNNKIVNVADGTNDTDAVNVRQLDAKTKAATTELTANGGESADNTTGNIVLTKTTAPDGHIIYDNKLNDKITLGAADPTKAITVDGTNGTIKAGKDGNAVAINGTDGTIKAGDGTNAVAIDGVNGSVKVADKIALNGKDGKAAIGTVGIDGKDGIITTGGNNPVAVNGKDGVVTGLTNKTWDPNNITSGRAATEDQVQSAVANAGWDATVGTEGSGVNSTPSAIPEKIRPNETLTFKAGNNMMVSHAGKTISYAVNPDLTDMKSATFKDAAGNTTVINGNGITITPGSANPNNPNAGPVSLTKDGLNNGNNQIKGVAPGSDDTDAVNIGQLKASNAKMGDAIGQVAGEVQRVGAHAAAMAALKPIQYDPLEPTQIMAGVGNYRGETAAALGLAHYTNEDTMFNVGVSVGGNHNMVNAGVTHKFGSSPEKKNIPDRYKAGPISSVYVMQDEVSSLKKENAEQKYVIADQAARLNTLEAENERQRQELAETKQGLDDLRAAVDKLLAAKG